DTASVLLPACPSHQLSAGSCDCSVLGHRAPARRHCAEAGSVHGSCPHPPVPMSHTAWRAEATQGPLTPLSSEQGCPASTWNQQPWHTAGAFPRTVPLRRPQRPPARPGARSVQACLEAFVC
ncbi:hypothetical protein MC885_001995, partial [Smutsia gigantea]